MKSRIITLVFVFAILGVMVACTGGQTPNAGSGTQIADSGINPAGTFPIVDERITLTVTVAEPSYPADFFTNWWTLELEETTNIHLDWHYINPAAFRENVTLMFAAGDLTDIVLSGVGGATRMERVTESQLAAQGQLRPLRDLIYAYGPNILDAFHYHPGLYDFVHIDGDIFSIPTIDDAFHNLYPGKMWINYDWLNYLGLPIPRTVDEFFYAMVAFRDRDPNQNGLRDEIPLSTSMNANHGALDIFLMNAFTFSPGPDRLYLQDGQVVFTATQPGFADGLRFLNNMFEEGLIYVDSFSQTQADNIAMNESGNVPVVGAFPGMHLGHALDVPNSIFWHQYRWVPPLQRVDGGPPVATWAPYGMFITGHGVVTRTASDQAAAAAIRLFDFMYTEDAVNQALRGREGIEWEWRTGGTGLGGVASDMVSLDVDANDPFFQNITWGQMFPTHRPIWYYSRIEFPADPFCDTVPPMQGRMGIFWDATSAYVPYAPPIEQILPPLAFPEELIMEVSQLKVTIDSFVNEMVAAFIVGNRNIDTDFDGFITELNRMGLPRYLELHQTVFDQTFGGR